MGNYKIKKGFDIELDGKPSCEIVDAMDVLSVGVSPQEIEGVRWRLLVSDGDTVKRGTALLESKKDNQFKLRSPSAGVITEIKKGARRFVDCITIKVDSKGDVETFSKFDLKQISSLDADTVLDQLVNTGYLAFLTQRPFSNIADRSIRPKSIFVNGMNTGPFQADAEVVVNDAPEEFQAGLDLLIKLTDGRVNLCLSKAATGAITKVDNVDIHTFTGVHPAGNTSVHISNIDPMAPTDVVWTIKAVDLVLIGKLFLNGELPENKIISLGGNKVKDGHAKHYRVLVGSPISALANQIEERDVRYISGDILSGEKITKESYLSFYQSSLTVIEESYERHFMGWSMPGFTDYSYSKTFVSSILNFIFGRKLVVDILGDNICRLNTNKNGGHRAMVLTGYYDKVMPMNIMVDYLIRAVLAKDTDEAIQLGILETAPEDFALCEFICPSKTEIQKIIKDGLDMIEEEGI